jgi:hypothetical protein
MGTAFRDELAKEIPSECIPSECPLCFYREYVLTVSF